MPYSYFRGSYGACQMHDLLNAFCAHRTIIPKVLGSGCLALIKSHSDQPLHIQVLFPEYICDNDLKI